MSSTNFSKCTTFGIIDCNNFYVSCERVFQPALENQPVLVLSNNDGCVISRCNRVKALGIKMGVPYFKIKDLVQKNNIQVFSSNYALYGDMSRKVMHALASLTPKIEIYSIDEAFIDFSNFEPRDLIKLSFEVVEKVKQWTGIPVTLGIGLTKTLAKVANHTAKKLKIPVFDISSQTAQNEWLPQIPIEDIWGIGRGWCKRLHAMNVFTAMDLKNQDAFQLRKISNLVLANTVSELQGKKCYDLEEGVSPRKQIIASRSFGKPLTSLTPLSQALSFHIARAAVKLRRQQSLVKDLMIFLDTSRFKNRTESYRASLTISLPIASNDSRILIGATVAGLQKIFKEGKEYKKIGVMFLEIVSKKHLQLDLFATPSNPKEAKVMELMDSINQSLGRNMVRIAAQGHLPPFIQTNRKSQSYTSCWKELLKVKASFDKMTLGTSRIPSFK